MISEPLPGYTCPSLIQILADFTPTHTLPYTHRHGYTHTHRYSDTHTYNTIFRHIHTHTQGHAAHNHPSLRIKPTQTQETANYRDTHITLPKIYMTITMQKIYIYVYNKV